MSVAKRGIRKVESIGRVEGVNPSLLRTYSQLGGLRKAQLEQLARGSECQLIPAGNTVYSQNDDADAVYMLLDGDVRLRHRNKRGEVSAYKVAGPRGTFGDIALLGAKGRYFTANTQSASIVIRTPIALLREVLATDPNLAQAWIHAVTTDQMRRECKIASTVLQGINPAFPDAA
jgi:CRP-like cAMP-binding protein